MNVNTNFDVLEVLARLFENCNEGDYSNGIYLHPAEAEMVHGALANLVEKAQQVLDNGSYEDFQQMRAAIARVRGE